MTLRKPLASQDDLSKAEMPLVEGAQVSEVWLRQQQLEPLGLLSYELIEETSLK